MNRLRRFFSKESLESSSLFPQPPRKPKEQTHESTIRFLDQHIEWTKEVVKRLAIFTKENNGKKLLPPQEAELKQLNDWVEQALLYQWPEIATWEADKLNFFCEQLLGITTLIHGLRVWPAEKVPAILDKAKELQNQKRRFR